MHMEKDSIVLTKESFEEDSIDVDHDALGEYGFDCDNQYDEIFQNSEGSSPQRELDSESSDKQYPVAPPSSIHLSFETEVEYSSSPYDPFFKDRSSLGSLLIKKLLKREISETFYGELVACIKSDLSQVCSKMTEPASFEAIGIIKTHFEIPSLATVKEMVISMEKAESEEIKDVVKFSNRHGTICSSLTFHYAWYSLFKLPLYRLVTSYFPKLTHISPFQSIPTITGTDPYDPCCYNMHAKAVEYIREAVNIQSENIIDFPSFDSISEYCAFCDNREITPYIIAPLIFFMDGVATARLGHSALAIAMTMANIPWSLRNANPAWHHICLIDESKPLHATTSALNNLTRDISLLQKGIRMKIGENTLYIVGYLLRIIGDGKQVDLNLAIHKHTYPCPWCKAEGMKLLLPHLPSSFETRGDISHAFTKDIKLSSKDMPLYNSCYHVSNRLLFSPQAMHAGEILHDLHIGLISDMIQTVERILNDKQRGIFNERMTTLRQRLQLKKKLRDGNDSRMMQHFAPLCLFELNLYRPSSTHAFHFLYSTDEDDVGEMEVTHRIVIPHIIPSISDLTDVKKLRFNDVLMMTAIADQLVAEIPWACSREVCKSIVNMFELFVSILSPLAVKAGVMSDTQPIHKKKTHTTVHLWQWVNDGGPQCNYTAETGERMNASIYRCYRYIRTQKKRHELASRSLPFLNIHLPTFDPDIHFVVGDFYLYEENEPDDCIVCFKGKHDDIDGDQCIHGSTFKYIDVASICGYNLFYLYQPQGDNVVMKKFINRKVCCATAGALKYKSIPSTILICPLRK
ncbi:hypothetical protein ADUPG1_008431 [Aduncisulcus paluster]|uniref:Uncharacterized protein n=1 Tax=Aduncisulcus paluster TaxID=2918883 RepID=A0ABQ5KRY6_9EUKA|nr:hypothetical protein ADUPG1_008431 [Aduncisulcus paluster]